MVTPYYPRLVWNSPSYQHPQENGLTPLEITAKNLPCSTPWLFKTWNINQNYWWNWWKQKYGSKTLMDDESFLRIDSFILQSCNSQIQNQYREWDSFEVMASSYAVCHNNYGISKTQMTHIFKIWTKLIKNQNFRTIWISDNHLWKR